MKDSYIGLILFPFDKSHVNKLFAAFLILLMVSVILLDSALKLKPYTVPMPIEKSDFKTIRLGHQLDEMEFDFSISDVDKSIDEISLEKAQEYADYAKGRIKYDNTLGILFFLSSIYCLTNIIIINKKAIA